MKLEYTILWVEDEKSWFDSTVPYIKDYFNEICFNLRIHRINDQKELEECITRTDFDLVLMDYYLSSITGDVLIEYIRKQRIFTEVIFYSQKGEEAVREIIKKKGIDGVYCASRNIGDFEEKVKSVVYTTIKKVQDINNVRGLVMAETSDLDFKMKTIISEFLKSNKEKQAELIQKTIINRQERLKKMENITINSINDFYDKLETSDKLRAILRFLKSKKKEHCTDYKDCENIMNTFKNEIIDIRNVLAHVKEEIDEKGNKVLRSIFKSTVFIFDDNTCINIRKNIKKHSENLDRIMQIIDKDSKDEYQIVAEANNKKFV